MKLFSQEKIWIPLGITAAFFAGLSMVFDSITASKISGAGVGVFNVALTLIMLIGVFLYKSSSIERTIEKEAIPFLAVSALCNAVGTVLYYIVMDYASVSDAAAVDQLTLIFVFVFAVIVLGEKITVKSVAGSVLLLIGMVMMMY